MSERPFDFRTLPSWLMVVPALTATRLRAWSILTTPCMFESVSCSPLVTATGVKEWPEPAQRTFSPCDVASRTISARAASLSGAPR
ncbi:hypothetical protein D9M72_644850 [compost metagenome]